jgi:L-fuculose-phosphate aldolase
MKYETIRRDLVRFGRRIADKDLVVGAGGNISARIRDVMLIKASGVAFEEAKPADYIPVSITTGRLLEKGRRPSSELPMHLACYRAREDVRAVVHTHSPYATGVASAGVTLRPIFPDFVAVIDSEVPTLPFVTPCGEELAEAVCSVIGRANAALLSNHGVVAVGENLKEAFYRAFIIEEAARALVAGAVLGKVRFLSDEEAARIRGLEKVQYRMNVLKKRK